MSNDILKWHFNDSYCCCNTSLPSQRNNSRYRIVQNIFISPIIIIITIMCGTVLLLFV